MFKLLYIRMAIVTKVLRPVFAIYITPRTSLLQRRYQGRHEHWEYIMSKCSLIACRSIPIQDFVLKRGQNANFVCMDYFSIK